MEGRVERASSGVSDEKSMPREQEAYIQMTLQCYVVMRTTVFPLHNFFLAS